MKTLLSMKTALLLVPILILAGMSLGHFHDQHTGTLWRIPITGYDPRDILRGHYLQFRYEWNLPQAARLCVGEECALNGSFIPGTDTTALSRYYVPETEANRLQRLLNNRQQDTKLAFAIGLRVSHNGHANIEELYIDNTPLQEWLQSH